MKATFTHLLADQNGVSYFREGQAELVPGFAVPPAEPLHSANFVHTGLCRWVGGPPDWKGDAPHPVPKRMLIIPVQGAFEVTAGDGVIRQFKPGDVLLAEDTHGTGHASRMVGGIDSIALFIEVAEPPT